MSSDPRPSSPQPRERGAPPGGASQPSYFGGITRALNVIGTALILVMAVAVNADVIGRNAFNKPIAGVLEFIGLSIVAIVFLQMANTLRENRHVANDVFFRLLENASPRTAAGLNVAFNAVGVILMSTIALFVWPLAWEAYAGGYYSGTAGVIEIPTWPFMAVIIVGAAATAIQFLLNAWRYLLIASGRRAA